MESGKCCLVNDAWSNVRNEPTVNYMAVTACKSLFIESVSTVEQGPGEWIARDLDRVMETLCDVVGAVTDNTSSHKLAWSILRKKVSRSILPRLLLAWTVCLVF